MRWYELTKDLFMFTNQCYIHFKEIYFANQIMHIDKWTFCLHKLVNVIFSYENVFLIFHFKKLYFADCFELKYS